MEISIKTKKTILFSVLLACFFFQTCSGKEDADSLNAKDNQKMQNHKPRLEGNAVVEIKLKSGIVKIEINGNDAPITAGNFVDLVDRGFYNGLTFHRVVKSPQPFVAQGGD